jgi:hypothetical protein
MPSGARRVPRRRDGRAQCSRGTAVGRGATRRVAVSWRPGASRRTDWFGDDVLWLAPEPDAPFRELTRSVVAAFPAHRPYGRLYDEATPHLTVGELRLGSADELAAAERAVRALLPIHGRVARAVVLAGRPEPDSWRPVGDFPLGVAG